MKIWIHTLVRDEEKYIWYALMSVINWVDKALIWDTGSSDNTVNIINEIRKLYPDKIDFKEVGEVDINKFTLIRQKMLEETESDWVILVDGDEVWWDDSIRKVVDEITKFGNKLEAVVNPYYNVVGDIFHHQSGSTGMYEIDGIRGHLTIRAMNRKIPGLHVSKPHGTQGFYDERNVLIQNRSGKKRRHLGAYFMHFTNVVRSESRKKDLSVPKRKIKFRYEMGIPFPLDFYYPEVFFRPRPSMVYSPWTTSNLTFKLKSALALPLRLAKRNLFKAKSGY